MTTKETVQRYYDAVARKEGWQSVISESMAFASPSQNTRGKDTYVQGTARFLQNVRDSKVKELIIEGDKAYALVDYEMVSPKGETRWFPVAEILSVKDEKIDSSTILFDTAAFRLFMTPK
jgi:ketosteroid isomerase-like protein